MALHAKMELTDSHRHHSTINRINNVEDIVVLWSEMRKSLVEKPQMKKTSFQNFKHYYLIPKCRFFSQKINLGIVNLSFPFIF